MGVPLVAADDAPLLARRYYRKGDPGSIFAALAHVPDAPTAASRGAAGPPDPVRPPCRRTAAAAVGGGTAELAGNTVVAVSGPSGRGFGRLRAG